MIESETKSPQRTGRSSQLTVARWAGVYTILVIVLLPHLLGFFGYHLVIVEGGSMAPTYQSGDVLVTSPPTGDDLYPGNILMIGQPPELYTHRVIKRSETTGQARARMKGDGNATPDPGWVSQEQVYAVPVLHLGGSLGLVVGFLTSTWGTIALVGVGIWLLFEKKLRSQRSRKHVEGS